MSPTSRVCLRKWIFCLSCAILLESATTVSADPKPLTKEEQAKVDKAIDKGVAFLKRSQRDKGDWPLYMRSGYALGQTLLPAYALLESGVPADDPAIRKAADWIRPRVLKVDRTYEVALAILFLDRLGDPKDKPLIRTLGMRLIAGQHMTGGWNYRCPTLGKEQEDALCKALAKLNKRLEAGEESVPKLLGSLEVPPSMKTLPVFRSLSDPSSLRWQDPALSEANQHTVLLMGTTDNSNTQFAMLGLWAAQRHDVPVRATFRLMIERFERSQAENGKWPYLFDRQFDRTPGSSMTCVGLLGLAVGRGLKLPTLGRPQPGKEDIRVLTGLAALSQDIGAAASQISGRPTHRILYYLWSVERVAMLYDLPTIGDKDWYRWGTRILVTSQKPSGNWRSVSLRDNTPSSNGPMLDTAFALLFLKHSHPMKDLTQKLPIKGEKLSQGIARLLSGALPLEPSTTAPSRNEKPGR